MKKMLKKVTSLESALRFFDEDGNITDVSNLRGDVSNLRGNVSYLLRGDVSNLRGDVSNLRGDVSNLSGNVSNLCGNGSYLLRGDVDDCEITKDERNAGVNIEDLIA